MPILCSIEPQVTPLRAPSEPSALTRPFAATTPDTPFIPLAPPALFARRREPEPAAFRDLPEGFLETFRGGHAAVVMAGTALEIADAIKRLQNLLAEFGRLAQNRLPDVGGRIAKAGKIVVAVDLKHVVEQEADIFQGGFVSRHGVLPAGWGPPLREILRRSNLSVPERDLKRFRRPRAGIKRAVATT